MSEQTKIIVLDDDPTGSQTVHGCLLLPRWDAVPLRTALLDAAPLFFVLTNTRGMDAPRAAAVTRAVCRNLKAALDGLRGEGRAINPVLVRRSDSTLRGHYPVETDVIAAEEGERFLLVDVRGELLPRLLRLQGNRCGVVDAERESDLEHFAAAVNRAAAEGKRFLFRSAASLLTALAALPPQPVAAEAMANYVRGGRAGAVVVGSHVRKSTLQLEQLLKEPDVVPIEIDVARIATPAAAGLLHYVEQEVLRAHRAEKTPVIYTSRTELTFADTETRLAFGEQVSAYLMEVVRALPADLGFLISKGGITSNDVLSSGLALGSARVLGQILAGCSVVRCPADHPRFPDMPVVIFPGNVGDERALATVLRRLRPH